MEGVETTLLDVDDRSEVGSGDGLPARFDSRLDDAETIARQFNSH